LIGIYSSGSSAMRLRVAATGGMAQSSATQQAADADHG
jgi:hypothetical protein